MFYEVEMRRRVVVEPHELGGALQTQRAMFRRLLQDVEGDVGSEEHGFYVTVTTVERVSEGHIRAGTGAVAFSVDFKCIVFSLSVDEVVEAQVTQVLPQGFFAGTKLHLTPSIACAMPLHPSKHNGVTCDKSSCINNFIIFSPSLLCEVTEISVHR